MENSPYIIEQLTHKELETFPANNPDFAKENFTERWNWLIGNSLKEFLENNSHH